MAVFNNETDSENFCTSDLALLLDLITEGFHRVKWLVPSRYSDAVESKPRPARSRMKLGLGLDAETHIAQAVNRYINSSVGNIASLRGYDTDLQQYIGSYIRSNAGGAFLWAALVCRQLADTPSRKAMNTVRSFPPGL
ncbi:hypothetical protein BDW68DRAFT_162473 [Aspergillus falconensis]